MLTQTIELYVSASQAFLTSSGTPSSAAIRCWTGIVEMIRSAPIVSSPIADEPPTALFSDRTDRKAGLYVRLHRLSDRFCERLDAAVERVGKDRLVGIPFCRDADRGFDHIVDRWPGDAPVHPVQGHLLRRVFPDLLVIRYHVALGDPFSERIVDPFAEGPGSDSSPFLHGNKRLHKLADAEEAVLWQANQKGRFRRGTARTALCRRSSCSGCSAARSPRSSAA